MAYTAVKVNAKFRTLIKYSNSTLYTRGLASGYVVEVCNTSLQLSRHN